MEIRGLKPIATHLKFTSWLIGLHMVSLSFIKLGCEQNHLLIRPALKVSNLMEHMQK